MVSAEKLEETIRSKVGGEVVRVISMEGGCSDKFEAFIVSAAFDGVKLLQRQRMVNEAIAEFMPEIHAFTFKKTMTPAQYVEWQKTNPQ